MNEIAEQARDGDVVIWVVMQNIPYEGQWACGYFTNEAEAKKLHAAITKGMNKRDRDEYSVDRTVVYAAYDKERCGY